MSTINRLLLVLLIVMIGMQVYLHKQRENIKAIDAEINRLDKPTTPEPKDEEDSKPEPKPETKAKPEPVKPETPTVPAKPKEISPTASFRGVTILMDVKDFSQIAVCNELEPQTVKTMEGCYVADDGLIYIKDSGLKLPKDFVLFHEVGHYLFNANFDRKLFDNDVEIMADQFGFWLFKQKYDYVNEMRADRERFFEEHCDKSCVDTILAIEIPGVSPTIEPFYFRQ